MYMDASFQELAWIAGAVFLLGVSKGGLPIAGVALPILILVWPDQAQAARSAVSFMLPLLCAMDIVALAFYRGHIRWKRLLPLFPGMLAGVVLASIVFVSDTSALVSISDRTLKLIIGILGLVFVAYRAVRKWLLKSLGGGDAPGWARSTVFGATAGVTSTLAHAAGPVMQMYLLPQELGKMYFAGTTAAFFFVLNLVKVVPFAALGRFESGSLRLAGCLLPLIPVGVATGYGLVRALKERHYMGFIYAVLTVTSAILVWKALG